MLWRTQFASDPDVLDRNVLLDGRSYEVIGVAPPGFRGPGLAELRERVLDSRDDGRRRVRRPTNTGCSRAPAFRCSRPSAGRGGGQRIEALQAHIDPLDEVLARDRVDSPYFTDTGQDWRVAALPGNYLRLWPEYREPVARVLLVLGLMAAVGAAGGLREPGDAASSSRGVERRRELAIRRAIGAGALDLSRTAWEMEVTAARGGRRNSGCGRAGLRG